MASKKELIDQLHRLNGQIRGIEKMIFKNHKASEIVQQIEAVRGNLKSVEKQILAQNFKNLGHGDLKKTLDYLLKIS
ncbi:MAG TPA: metal-sensing transcriptional repressor [Patescibacteria group bacterium]|nr:metal-sensing transcriptional repressor [Patescibacteria group bacterium]